MLRKTAVPLLILMAGCVLAASVAAAGDQINVGLGLPSTPVDRSDPRATIAGLLEACQRGDFDNAAHYLDLGDIAAERQSSEGRRLARRLMLVLLRKAWVDPEQLTPPPRTIGGPSEAVELTFAKIVLRHQEVELRLERLEYGKGYQWLVSRGSVAMIDPLYRRFGYSVLGDRAPVVLFSASFAGLQLWQWAFGLAGLLVAWLVSRLLAHAAIALFKRVARRTDVQWDDLVAQAAEGAPAVLVVLAGVLAIGVPWLGLPPDSQKVARELCKLVGVIGFGMFLLRLVDATAAHLRAVAARDNPVGAGFLPIFVRFAKVLVVFLVALGGLSALGIQFLAVLGGLGIGALAVALAAQKTLENVFGAVAIAADQPFQVGDYVAIGEDRGTVEDIGFRSTRMRTLARTVVTIPNGVVVADRIENISARDRILFNPTLTLSFATTSVQLEATLAAIRELLGAHAMVFQDEKRVRFAGFGDFGFGIEVVCWVLTRDYSEYTRVVEELNLGIVGAVERVGASFAMPARVAALASASSK
jgi:MscS family membrane protein